MNLTLIAFAAVFWGFALPILAHSESAPAQNETAAAKVDHRFFEQKIQPLFNARCIACHSCFESPCQMNLQSYAGAQRGANHISVYSSNRTEKMMPTRLFEDAHTEKEWRAKDFVDVLQGGEDSLFWRMISMTDRRQNYPTETVRENLTCAKSVKELEQIETHRPELGMPYALPALSPSEKSLLNQWIQSGAPGAVEELSLKSLATDQRKVAQQWQAFLNRKDLKSRVLSRYLFEHFFLAHFYFPGNDKQYLRLVRSKTNCDDSVQPVLSRQPNDDPGVKDWYYCFYVDPMTTVYKKHIPYQMTSEKLNWIERNFSREAWTATQFPSFKIEISRNPFATFKEIPPAARYRFLIEDSRYHIMTFIKGPVCNGSVAVSAIQEQFFVFFMDPKSDVNLIDPEFAKKSENLLVLPGNFDAHEGMSKTLTDFKTLADLRNQYRKLKADVLEKTYPTGLGLNNIWDGDGQNPNAVLTVFRHDDNAEVMFGARGDLSKTIFLLDYSIFERLVYNLVVNFDVFADVKHQALTRLYMDLIRMEAENSYLDFLPPAERLAVKKFWYRGSVTNLLMDVLNEHQFPKIPAKINFSGKESKHLQLIQKILFERFNNQVRGADDNINWRSLKNPEQSGKSLATNLTPEDLKIKEIASRSVTDKAYFAKIFPEFSILALTDKNQVVELYSLIRNREFQNISWMFAEHLRRDPDADTLTVIKGIAGAYPNQIFKVDKSQLGTFVSRVNKLGFKREYDLFEKKYGLSRRDPDFWKTFDQIQEHFQKNQKSEAGYLDLSRYRMEYQLSHVTPKFSQ